VLDRIGVGVIRLRRSHGGLQRQLYLSEIGRIVGEAILLRLEVRPRRHNIHVFGLNADRIAAVAADVGSKRDEFRSIDAHLASLLGTDQANKLAVDAATNSCQGRATWRPPS
jgi:hypothetical protein